MELHFIDIEWINRGYIDKNSECPVNEYFVYIKQKSGWEEDFEADFGDILPVNMNTIEDLEKDMFNQLIKHAKKYERNLFTWNN